MSASVENGALERNNSQQAPEKHVSAQSGEHPAYQVARVDQSVSQRSSSKWVAVAIVALLIVAGVGYYITDNYGHSSELAFQVYSTHITENVDVQVTIDGQEYFTYSDLEPGHYCYNGYYVKYHFSLFENSKIIEITAKSIGGALGVQTDVETILVEPGEKYTVEFHV